MKPDNRLFILAGGLMVAMDGYPFFGGLLCGMAIMLLLKSEPENIS
jgi:hypothetical protein